jgi:Leucine-rich repeat (LRR) protein
VKFNKKERRFWKTKFSFGLKNIPEYIDHLKLRDEYFTNEELCFITKRVREMEKLDLDNNKIDDEGIPCLTKIKGLKELRLKSLDLTDKCVEILCELENLELLHLGGTSVTCDGILKLSKLRKLKLLLASPEKVDEQKLDQFLTKLPECKLVINSKPYPPGLI